jgi:NADH-quinone oxidoreductase subunit H
VIGHLYYADTSFAEATWIQVVKAIAIFAFILAVTPMVLLLERKLMGRMQSRYGPNRVGPYGLFQPLADVVKLLTKESSTPVTAVPWMMTLAPMISVLTAVMTLAIIPWGDRGTWSDSFGLYGIDVPIGVLYMFAFGSIAFYGFLLGGWASGSKFSFLGSMRSAAQLISYEVSLGLALLGVVIMAQSLSLVDIVNGQDSVWYIVPQFFGFCVFLVAGFAETARPPFDLPEADAELVAGYNTEYGGMRFGAFYMAEYMHIIVFSGLATALFLGGWHGPGPIGLGPLWVTLKMFLVVCFFIWARATLPRLRYDQLMSFGWKVLLPLATLNALVTAILVVVLD